jgi:hypothetical protein
MSHFKSQISGCDHHPKFAELFCHFLGETMNISTATLGYPRIGKNREVKKALVQHGVNKQTIIVGE